MTPPKKSLAEVMLDTLATEGAKRISERMMNAYMPPTIEAFMKEQMRVEAEREIYNVLSMVKQRFKNAATVGANMMKPRTEMLAACKVLQVPFPRRGKPVDLAQAAKNRKAQMRLFHPDISPNTRDDFEAAVKAYATLVTYNASLEKPDAPT